jgi:hypothetical protein
MKSWHDRESAPFWCRISALFGVACLLPGGLAQVFAPPPMRLAVRAARNTVAAGTRAQLTVLFLDRNYRPTSNDRKRSVELRQESLASAGAVQMPQTVEAMPGQREFIVEFVALKPGRVLIRVMSDGLEPGSVLLTVASPGSSAISLLPLAWAQDSPKTEIVMAAARQAPANGTSLVSFFAALDRSTPSETQLRIDSIPPCVLLYAGKNTRPAEGSLIITIPPGEQSSLEIQARSFQAGGVQVSARALPNGSPAVTTLTFEEPQPASLAFEERPLSIPVAAQSVPLRLHLADQDSIRLDRLHGSVDVLVSASGDRRAVQLEPGTFALTAKSPARDVFLTVTDLPSAEELHVYASAQDGSLRSAEKMLGFQTRVGRLKVIVPDEIDGRVPIEVKARFLYEDTSQDREAATEFRRTVTFLSDRGKFEPESVTVEAGATYAKSMFVGQDSGEKARLTISTRGPKVVTIEVLVTMALWALALIALGSGVIGGLARFFYYREESGDIRPTKTARGWNPGLLGNALFCGVFGVVALLMARYGLIDPFDPRHQVGFLTGMIHTPAGAFLLGIAGGFVGVGILELLAERLGLADALDRREKRKRSAAAGSSGQTATADGPVGA